MRERTHEWRNQKSASREVVNDALTWASAFEDAMREPSAWRSGTQVTMEKPDEYSIKYWTPLYTLPPEATGERDCREELEFLRSVKESRGKELDEKDAEIERLREKYSEKIYQMTNELVERTDVIERLRGALEELRYDWPTYLSDEGFDIVEAALKEDK
jgi:hypothetical protein